MTSNVDAPHNSLARLVGRSAFVLAIASTTFIIPGIVRTKLSAFYFGEEGIALFGQLSQMQTLLISLGAAGIVTAARVVLSRPGISGETRRRLLSWCLWIPFLGSLALALLLSFLGTPISGLILGSSVYGAAVTFAALGLPFAVIGQVSIAGAQVSGSRWALVGAAIGSAVIGSSTVWAFMSVGDQTMGAISFIAAPAIQFIFVVLVCSPVRSALGKVPWMNREILSEISVIAWASAVLGICASGGELLARSLIIQQHGLSSLAAYQPVATVVTQLVSIGLSALAVASIVELSRISDRIHLGLSITSLEQKFVPLVGVMCGFLLSASPLLVTIFFKRSLWESAYPLMVIAVSFEAVRAAVWLAGSAFLPNGMRMAWLVNGLITVAVQISVVVALSSYLGPLSLPIGFACANVVSLLVTLSLLRRRGIPVNRMTVLLPLVLAALLILSSFWQVTILNAFVAGPLAYSILLSAIILFRHYSRMRQKNWQGNLVIERKEMVS